MGTEKHEHLVHDWCTHSSRTSRSDLTTCYYTMCVTSHAHWQQTISRMAPFGKALTMYGRPSSDVMTPCEYHYNP